ncbi:hypothetical protein HT031_002723 [Scenedesmus sp. PABB004]|nr:hypothetical protein HT031_002723 [Scenedesmus sp. PABB004]
MRALPGRAQLAAALLLALAVAGAAAGKSGSRSTFSSAVAAFSGRPSTSSYGARPPTSGGFFGSTRPPTTYGAPYRPPTGAMGMGAMGGAMGGMGAAAGRFGGAKPFSYGRPGFKSSRIAVPLAAGALAGGALYALSSSSSAYCNGFSVQCYKAACANALAQCDATRATALVTARCPDSRFSECWATSDRGFECFGRRRPAYGGEDIAAYCNAPQPGSQQLGQPSSFVPGKEPGLGNGMQVTLMPGAVSGGSAAPPLRTALALAMALAAAAALL